ncbi:MAG: nucleoside triphosphate pyrophosphatase [Granulosicoccus sp.]
MTASTHSVEQPAVLILASQSQQRFDLLRQLGFAPQCLSADVDETPLPDESPAELVVRLACLKASACVTKPGFSDIIGAGRSGVVLAADTVIDLDGQILGKPNDETQALDMLEQLSGRSHRVHSGVCVQRTGVDEQYTVLVTTIVEFAHLSRQKARYYWLSGEPQGKAGSYAIQGSGAQFVVHLEGSYSNVVGLPLYETTQLLARAGLTSL